MVSDQLELELVGKFSKNTSQRAADSELKNAGPQFSDAQTRVDMGPTETLINLDQRQQGGGAFTLRERVQLFEQRGGKNEWLLQIFRPLDPRSL